MQRCIGGCEVFGDDPHLTGVSRRPSSLQLGCGAWAMPNDLAGERAGDALQAAHISDDRMCGGPGPLVSEFTVRARRVASLGGFGASFGGMVVCYHAPQR